MAHEHHALIEKIPEGMKHVLDGGSITTYAAAVVQLITDILNPIATFIGVCMGLVWSYYRIKELRQRTSRVDKHEREGDN